MTQLRPNRTVLLSSPITAALVGCHVLALALPGCGAHGDAGGGTDSEIATEPDADSAQSALVDQHRLQNVYYDHRPRHDLDGNGIDEVWGQNFSLTDGSRFEQLALEALPTGGMRLVTAATAGVQYGLFTYDRTTYLTPIGDTDGTGTEDLFAYSSQFFGLMKLQPGGLSGFARSWYGTNFDGLQVLEAGHTSEPGKFFDNDPTTYVALNRYEQAAIRVLAVDRGGFRSIAKIDGAALSPPKTRLKVLGIGRFWGRNLAQGWFAEDGDNALLLKANNAGSIEIRATTAWATWGLPRTGGSPVFGVRDFFGTGEESVLLERPGSGFYILQRSGSTLTRALFAPFTTPVAGYRLLDPVQPGGTVYPPIPADLDGDGRVEIIARSVAGDILVLRANASTKQFDLVAAHPANQWIGGWRLAPDHELVATGHFERRDRDALVIKSSWGIGMIGWAADRGFYAFASAPFDR